MPDIQKSMKLSLAFGLSGAVILPVLYEVYANISAAAGLVLIAVWAVCAGAKFSEIGRASCRERGEISVGAVA